MVSITAINTCATESGGMVLLLAAAAAGAEACNVGVSGRSITTENVVLMTIISVLGKSIITTSSFAWIFISTHITSHSPRRSSSGGIYHYIGTDRIAYIYDEYIV